MKKEILFLIKQCFHRDAHCLKVYFVVYDSGRLLSCLSAEGVKDTCYFNKIKQGKYFGGKLYQKQIIKNNVPIIFLYVCIGYLLGITLKPCLPCQPADGSADVES